MTFYLSGTHRYLISSFNSFGRLDNALVLAKEFDTAVKTELRILKDFEDTLRGLGPIADDLETIADQLSEHKVRAK